MDETGRFLGERGKEFGTVTGRRRRCGWFDAAMVRQAVQIGGVDGIALTKLDVLDGLDSLKICVGYDFDGQTFEYFPSSQKIQAGIRPNYESLEGWSESTQGVRSWGDLPTTAIKYIRRVEELIGVPVTCLLYTSPSPRD